MVIHRLKIGYLFFFLLFTGCYCIHSWAPENMTKKEWRTQYGEVDTSDQWVDVECTHVLFFDFLKYHQSKLIHLNYTLGDSDDDLDGMYRKMIQIQLFTTNLDTLKFINKQVDVHDINLNTKINFSFKGIKKTRRLNLFLKYSRELKGKKDTVSKIIILKRRLLLRAMPIIHGSCFGND